ncbi:MAG: hypothetical protein PHV23_04355 [Candidatus Gracilibacteria bacterium]|nr:hypothetical protein [Candidatus Gracilibacteria bacterium]
MKKPNKSDYSTRETLKNIQLVDGYSFTLKKDIHAVGTKKGDFEEGDVVEILKIELKEEHDNSTHEVKFKVTNKKGKTKEYEMSGGVFLKNFIEELNESDISYKVEKIKDNVKTKVVEVTSGVKDKPKKWHEKIKDAIK